MSDVEQQIQKLMRTARGKSDGDVALLEEAARLADLHGEITLGMRVRIRLINAANLSGNHELVLVAFTWCLAQMDRDPNLQAGFEREVLWYYKWVVESLSDYSQVSRQQLEKSFADMTARYTRAGYTQQALHKCRAYTSIRLGDIAMHREEREKWRNSPEDEISDCAACQTHAAVEFDLEAGKFEQALKTAEPIIQRRQACSEVPCLTFGQLLLPLLKLQQRDLAENLHLSTIRQTLSTRDFLASAGEHCAYLALTGKFSKAIQTFETGLAWLMITKRNWERMHFLQNTVVLFERLTAAGDAPMQLKVPQTAPFYQADDSYHSSQVVSALQQMHEQLMADFNRRNGNDYVEQRYHQFRELVSAINPL